MTRKEYLSKLQSSLCFRLPESEIAEIILDMEECFDAGNAEGKTEEQVCTDLGDPKSAAREIMTGRAAVPKRGKTAVPAIISRYAPYTVGVLLGAGFFLLAGKKGSSVFMMTAAVLLPLLVWFILERKRFFTGIFAARADVSALLGTVAAFLSAPLSVLFVYDVLTTKPAGTLIFSYGSAAIIVIGNILLALSVLKSGMPKLLCIIPAAFAGMALVTLFLSADSIYMVHRQFQSGTELYLSSDMEQYFVEYGRVMRLYLDIIIAFCFVCFVWAVVNKNAFSVPELYLSVSGGFPALSVRHFLLNLDPNVPYELVNFAKAFAKVFTVTETAAVLVLIAVSAARFIAGKKEKAADNSAKDGDR